MSDAPTVATRVTTKSVDTTSDTTSATTSTPTLCLRGVSKSYTDRSGNVTSVLDGLDLEVAPGEFVAVLGFSGTGKTTLVSAIAGLIEIDAGEVLVNGRPSVGPGPDRGVVFQSYSLMPWLDVTGNVSLAVDAVHATKPKAERRAMVDATIDMVGLSHAKDRKVSQLSGGMRQRVAVARALSTEPEILLLDEPLSALDALTRAKLQDEIERIRGKEKRTILLVTNDVDEALLLADRIAVLDQGPGSRISKVFDVTVERPRVRTELNHDPTYVELRNSIVGHLDELNGEKPEIVRSSAQAPNLQPTELLPKAYREAASSTVERRYLELFNLKKIYPTPTGPLTVCEDVNLLMDKGDFVSLIGHSGCGKSTVLTMAAGLNEVSDGGIVLDNREIDGAGPDKAVVFQAPSLLPWLTARENVELGVDRVYPDASQQERSDVVEYYLSRVGLAEAMDKSAAELSNGMKQRVGLARAFALSPKLLLLDEPFGMLDSLTRWDLQDVLVEVWNRTRVTTICVTHDVDEAILLADRVVMMTNGPHARIGKVLEIDLPRPRDRKQLLEDPRFYGYREEILTFLAKYEHGAHGEEL